MLSEVFDPCRSVGLDYVSMIVNADAALVGLGCVLGVRPILPIGRGPIAFSVGESRGISVVFESVLLLIGSGDSCGSSLTVASHGRSVKLSGKSGAIAFADNNGSIGLARFASREGITRLRCARESVGSVRSDVE